MENIKGDPAIRFIASALVDHRGDQALGMCAEGSKIHSEVKRLLLLKNQFSECPRCGEESVTEVNSFDFSCLSCGAIFSDVGE